VTENLQLDQVTIIELDDAPRLLVEWSPRWREFFTSIGPAFARSGPRLAGEAPLGGIGYRNFVAALILQLLFIFAVVDLPRQIDRLRPYAPPKLRPYEVIYYSGDELPRTEDLSGSQSGKTATAGGQEAHHRTQTIRIARGNSLSGRIVDAPDVKLPSSDKAVANLLAFKSALPSPSAENLRPSLKLPALSANVVAPAPPDVAGHSRTGLTLSTVVPPAPKLSAERSRSALSLQSEVVPPAPVTPSDHVLIAPRLDTEIIAPAPKVSRQNAVRGPSLTTNVIAPPSTQVSADQSRSAPALSTRVIAPAPSTNGLAVPSTRVEMTNIAVVPPPVSAPVREDIRNAKLHLPAPSVVAPPPSADSAQDLRRLESGVAASSPTVVPPPPTQAAAPSFMSSIIGKIFGTQDVVPPPPSVSSEGRSSSRELAANIVPPPPSAGPSNRGSSRTLAPDVVPPAPSTGGGASGVSRMLPPAPAAAIVPPPPAVSAATGGTFPNTISSHNLPAPEVVPPPPSVSSASASGSARKSFSRPAEADSALAPPKNAGVSRDNSGVVASTRPGSDVGLPGKTSKGGIAISPSGGEKAGLGGSGSGTGIGNAKGTGSGVATDKPAANTGAGKTSTGHGFDQTAHGGISTTPGPGGAGSLAAGSPAVPGVDVQGGTTVVTLPSFGSDGGDPNPNLPRRSSVKSDQGPAITIVATSRSGGVFDFYGKLPGNNYAVYIDTNIGTVVMQFAEANPGPNAQDETLVGPEAIRADLSANLPRARMVVKCLLTTSGNLANLQVLEPGPATMTAKIMAALPGWKFRPAMRGSRPVEVNAILGFNINTNDRY
jgi:hypothetical protein